MRCDASEVVDWTGLTNAIDPNAPKRGLSAYMFFANEQRQSVRDDNPDVTFGQVGKILGERWKALNEKQRAPYDAKAAADKKRYEDEKQAYNVSPLVLINAFSFEPSN